jgi:hypothetical protein
MLTRTPGALAAFHDRRIWLEPMNEPQIGWNPEDERRWQEMLEAIYRDIRAVAPQLGLVLTGGSGGGPEGLLAVDARPFEADPYAVFTFNYYYPYAFTHQTIGARRFLSGVPYPAHPKLLPSALHELVGRINNSPLGQNQKRSALAENERALRAYFSLGFDRAAIGQNFDEVTQWAARYRIDNARILLGEFGAVRAYGQYRGARDEDRARWLRDVRDEAENRAFGWAVWAYRGEGGMAIIDDNGSQSQFDEVTLGALGLLPPRSKAAPDASSCQPRC